jgi:hypothetical protein
MFPLRLSTILALWFVAMSLCDATTILNCVGDSITAGVGVSGPLVAIQSYPARLQQLFNWIDNLEVISLSKSTHKK